MTVNYIVEGEKISGWLRTSLSDKIDMIELMPSNEQKSLRRWAQRNCIEQYRGSEYLMLPVLDDENGESYFEVMGTKVMLNSYTYMTAEKLVSAFKNNDFVYTDDFVQTMLQEGNKIGFIVPLKPFSVMVPRMGFGIVDSEKSIPVLCIPNEEQYSRNQWTYKMGMHCYEEQLRQYLPTENYYTSDFISLIKSGIVKIVMLDDYLTQEEINAVVAEKEDSKLLNRILIKLGLKKSSKENLTLTIFQ